jgi:hypothetical protein
MDNPSLILQTVDKHLDHEVRLVIYGRAALWLGFDGSPPEAARTQDVDAIISTGQESELEADAGFMIRHARTTESQLLGAFAQMKPIELVELRDAFAKAKPIILKMVREVGPK